MSKNDENWIDIVFDGPPGPEAGRFVEVEDSSGMSIKFGEWIARNDGCWALRFTHSEHVSSGVIIDAKFPGIDSGAGCVTLPNGEKWAVASPVAAYVKELLDTLPSSQPEPSGELEALRRIKALVCGERWPNWADDFTTCATRGQIADICDAALRASGGNK